MEDALDALRPDLVILVESGFWPTFIGLARERGVPVVVVNGRMSERSAGRFGAWEHSSMEDAIRAGADAAQRVRDKLTGRYPMLREAR